MENAPSPPSTVMQKARKRLQTILQKYKNLGLPENAVSGLDATNEIFKKKFPAFPIKKKVILGVATAAFLIFYFGTSSFQDSECLVEMPSDGSKWFREPETCNICTGVSEVKKIRNATPTKFYHEFVYGAKPVVVADGAADWPALQSFTFDFFKDIYKNTNVNSRRNCQFFPYKTEFTSLEEALGMKPERARLEEGQKSWYIGWSNCNDQAGKILREHHKPPYFLPNTSENMALNWIFMGGPGHGAHMHVDNVQYPSWQAQLRGKKLWRLAPPPECYYKCQEIQVTVEPGEIMVDTNRWYHQTLVLPGEISITIGSEFD